MSKVRRSSRWDVDFRPVHSTRQRAVKQGYPTAIVWNAGFVVLDGPQRSRQWGC